jgi:ferritin-like metal-binding protein YciE
MTEIHKLNSLHQLLEDDSRKFTSGEILLLQHLPIWISKANSLQLKTILQKYLDLVKAHVNKLDNFFEEAEINYLSSQNKIMQAFIEDAEVRVNNCTEQNIRDAAILAIVQNINHYKISTYGTAAAFANTLNMNRTAAIFYECEINEKEIDKRLSELAKADINNHAKITDQIA